MGIYPDAELIFGIAIDSSTDDGAWYDEDEGFRPPFETDRIEVRHVGHYEDPEPKAILTLKHGCRRFRADAWDFHGDSSR